MDIFKNASRRALQGSIWSVTVAGALALSGAAYAAGEGADAPRQMSPTAKPVEHDANVFGSDPAYEDKPYDAEEQIKIYGGKTAVIRRVPLSNSVVRYTQRAVTAKVQILLAARTCCFPPLMSPAIGGRLSHSQIPAIMKWRESQPTLISILT